MIKANITSIAQTGNQAIVQYEIREGYEHDVEITLIDKEPEMVTVFETNFILKSSSKIFDYFPVPENDITLFLNSEIDNFNNLTDEEKYKIRYDYLISQLDLLNNKWVLLRENAYGTWQYQNSLQYNDLVNGTTIWKDHITNVKAIIPSYITISNYHTTQGELNNDTLWSYYIDWKKYSSLLINLK